MKLSVITTDTIAKVFGKNLFTKASLLRLMKSHNITGRSLQSLHDLPDVLINKLKEYLAFLQTSTAQRTNLQKKQREAKISSVTNLINKIAKAVDENEDKSGTSVNVSFYYYALPDMLEKINKLKKDKGFVNLDILEVEDGKIIRCFRRFNVGIESKYIINLHLGLYKKDTRDFLTMKQMMNHSEIFQDMCKAYESAIKYIGINSKTKIPNIRSVQRYSPKTVISRDDVHQDKITNKYTQYMLNTEANTFSDIFIKNQSEYLTNNYKQYSCTYVNIIATFKESFDKIYKKEKSKLTYELLFNLFNPNKKYEDATSEDFGTTPEQELLFFKKYHLGYRVLDVRGNPIPELCYMPENFNKNISPKVMNVMKHNEHNYLLNNNTMRLNQILPMKDIASPSAKAENSENKPLSCSNNFNVKSAPEQTSAFIYSLDDIVNVCMKQDESVSVKQSKKRILFYVYDLKLLLGQLIYDYKYEPYVKTSGGMITSITLGLGDEQVVIQNPDQNDERISLIIDTDYHSLYSKLDYQFYSSIINKNTMSRYSESIMSAFHEYKRPNFSYAIKQAKGSRMISAVDYNKAYPSNLLDMEYAPVFNSFDKFIAYDGHKLEDCNLYIVESLTTSTSDIVYFDSNFVMVFGYTLKYIPSNKYNIRTFCRPYKLVKLNTKTALKDIYDSTLLMEHKKFIPNKNIGCCKLKNKVSKTSLFQTEAEAVYFSSQTPNSRVESIFFDPCVKEEKYQNPLDEEGYLATRFVRVRDARVLYAVIQEEKADCVDGCYPIQYFVYDIMRLKLWQKQQELESMGNVVVGFNTDCIYYHGSYKTECTNKNAFEAIGQLKYERDVDFCKPMKQITATATPIACPTENPITTIDIIDEYDMAEIKSKLDVLDHVYVRACVPGAGKSSLIKNYIKTSGLLNKSLFIVPCNTLRLEVVRNDGLNCITLAKLLSRRFEEGAMVNNKKKYNLDGIELICFDEVNTYAMYELELIVELMKSYPEIKFVATGDHKQLKPIQTISEYVDYTKYSLNVLNGLFPNQITLKICKRVHTEAHRQKIYDMAKDIDNSNMSNIDFVKKYCKIINKYSHIPVGSKCLSYLNSTAERVSKYIYKRTTKPKETVLVHDIQYYKGLDLICKESKTFGKDKRLFVNYTYQIESINEQNTTVIDVYGGDGETFTLKTTDIPYLFRLPYCNTVHSFQGATVNCPVTIFDLAFHRVSREWLWVATTRCTNPDDVYVYLPTESEDDSKPFEEYMQTKIDGYKAQDQLKNRAYEERHYIDVDWIKNALQKCDYKCSGHGCTEYIQCERNTGNMTVDRIDSSLAHVKTNCKIMCKRCNAAKSNTYVPE